jgi:hypothetical protein
MRKLLYVLLPVLVALALRLYPYTISGLPFSTDAWPLVRNTELLVKNTPVPLNARIFDGYNNYYPISSIFGAVVAETIGLKPIEAMAIFLPVTGALSILIFYALVRMLYDEKTGFVAAIIFATAYTHAIFTAGVTKETYASPLYLLLIFIFLHPKLGKWTRLLLFTFASTILISTHHFTSFVAIIALSSIALAEFINSHRAGLASQKHRLILPLILIAGAGLYYELFASAGFQVPLLPSDWLSAASYQVLAFSITLYITVNASKPSKRYMIVECLAALIITTLIVLLTTRRPLLPGAPLLPTSYIIYGTPFIIASALIILGVGGQNAVSRNKHLPTLFWFAAVLGLEGYASFGIPGLGFGLAYRTLNFIQPPLAIFSALGLCRLYNATNRSNSKKLMKTLAMTALLAITILNSYGVYAAVSLQERYMGYFWLYTMPEYHAGAWIAKIANNQTVAADVKVSYLLKGYFNVSVDSIQGLKYLAGKTVSEPQILLVYDQMVKNGYVLSTSYSVDLPENWMEKLSSLNSIYSNGHVTVNAQ